VGEAILGAGRDAEIVDLGGGRVLRRPRRPRPLDGEALLMRHVAAAGYPAPAVLEVRPDGLVLERVEGATLLDDLRARPWRLRRHARTLADLHRALHRIQPPAGARPTYGPAAEGDVTVHGDLHPGNVLLSPRGPVVIDWANAGRGPAGADVADAWLVLAAARPPAAGPAADALVRLLRARFLAEFLAAAGRADAVLHLALTAERRSTDHHMSEAELELIRRVVISAGG
jgi:aminoglycoside phosphotransferase (APT) family kinase protein